MSNLEKMFIEDAPQQVNELNNVESLSSHVLELQKLEDEIKMDEEKLTRKKQQADKLSQQIGRAHVWTPVTVNNLVCRLLLEKKKKKKQK